ncbi:MAG: UbiH/UbiF/VisC/COQ6 family ubiquinone biosynthesis hydroxylase, partial [Alphaproteobacteria bacterium]|nr:UbiH/UbiF/VisC/COQ6 family ubiquinone biosynthesis hydroxylase [Alphaproteobacteria bacterium]
ADGRTTALSHASTNLMMAIGLWDKIAPQACPILDIRVSDGDAPVFLHYDHAEIGEAPLGHIVENRHLWNEAYNHVTGLKGVTYLAPATVESLERDTYRARALFDDGAVRAALVLGCDGRNSSLREQAGIAVSEWDYGQTAIVLTVAHDEPHGNIAHERFLPAGPFAILPMPDDEKGRHRSSVVWTERADLAPTLLDLPQTEFAAELARRFGDFLGDLEIIGERWSYSLSFLHAQAYTDTRLALVGDAAHAMHPIAGQGLNMGLRDVAALTEILVEAKSHGQDIGDGSTLARYARWRRFDNTALMFVTDALNRLFSNSFPPIRDLRDIGLAAVNATPKLKRLFMRQAMGLAGDLPRLLKGVQIR